MRNKGQVFLAFLSGARNREYLEAGLGYDSEVYIG
jgi:hypothetical protein